MISAFFTALSAKLSAANPQIDFGNTAVGVATILLALTSLYLANRASKINNKHKIADFRQAWLEDLRVQVALYIKLCVKIGINRSHPADAESFVELLSRLAEVEAFIMMKLNPLESDHKALMEGLLKLRELSFTRADSVTTVTEAEEMASDEARLFCINQSKIVLKNEWDRLKDEIRGLSSSRRLAGRVLQGWKNNLPQNRWTYDVLEKAKKV